MKPVVGKSEIKIKWCLLFRSPVAASLQYWIRNVTKRWSETKMAAGSRPNGPRTYRWGGKAVADFEAATAERSDGQ